MAETEAFIIEIKADDSGALEVFARTKDGLKQIAKVARSASEEIAGTGNAAQGTTVALSPMKGGLLAAAAAMEIAKTAMGALATSFQIASAGADLFFAGISRLDKIEEMSTRTGTTVELLSKLDLASRTAGVGLAGIGLATNQLSRFMYLASQGVLNQKRAFEDLGISVLGADGRLRRASEVLIEMAAIMPTIKNETERTSLALSTMGRAGANMMSILLGGSKSLEESIRLNRILGLEVNRYQAELADSIDNNMVVVSSILSGVQTQLAIGFSPAIDRVTSSLVQLVEAFGIVDGSVEEIGRSVGEWIEGQSIPIIHEFIDLVNTVELFKDGVLTPEGKAKLDAALDTIYTSLVATLRIAGIEGGRLLWAGVKAAWSAGGGLEERAAETAQALSEGAMLPRAYVNAQLEELEAEITERTKEIQSEFAGMGNMVYRALFGGFQASDLEAGPELMPDLAKHMNMGGFEKIAQAGETVSEAYARWISETLGINKALRGSDEELDKIVDQISTVGDVSGFNPVILKSLIGSYRELSEALDTGTVAEETLSDGLREIHELNRDIQADLQMEIAFYEDAHRSKSEFGKSEILLLQNVAAAEDDAAKAHGSYLRIQYAEIDLLRAGKTLKAQHIKDVHSLGLSFDVAKGKLEKANAALEAHHNGISLEIQDTLELTEIQDEKVRAVTNAIAVEEERIRQLKAKEGVIISEIEVTKILAKAKAEESARKQLLYDQDQVLNFQQQALLTTAIKNIMLLADKRAETAELVKVNKDLIKTEEKLANASEAHTKSAAAANKLIQFKIKTFKKARASGLNYEDSVRKVARALIAFNIGQKIANGELQEADRATIALALSTDALSEQYKRAQEEAKELGNIGNEVAESLSTALKDSFTTLFDGGSISDVWKSAGKNLASTMFDQVIDEKLSFDSYFEGNILDLGKFAAENLFGGATANYGADFMGPLPEGAVRASGVGGAGGAGGVASLSPAVLSGGAVLAAGAAGVGLGGAIGDAIGGENAKLGGMIGGGIGGVVGAAGTLMAVAALNSAIVVGTMGFSTGLGISAALGALAATGVGLIAAAVLAAIFALLGSLLDHVPTYGTQIEAQLRQGILEQSEALTEFSEITNIGIDDLLSNVSRRDKESEADFIARTGRNFSSGGRGRGIVNRNSAEAGPDYIRRNQYLELRERGLSEEEIHGVLSVGGGFGGPIGAAMFAGPSGGGLRGGGQDTFGRGRGESSAWEAGQEASLRLGAVYVNAVSELMGEGHDLETAQAKATLLVKDMMAEVGVDLNVAISTLDDTLFMAQQSFKGLGKDWGGERPTIDPVTGELIDIDGMHYGEYRAATGAMADDMISMAEGWEVLFEEEIPAGLRGVDIMMAGLGDTSFDTIENVKAKLQEAIESGVELNEEQSAQFVLDWTRSAEEVEKALSKIWEVGSAEEGIEQYLSGAAEEIVTQIRAAVSTAMMSETGGIAGAMMPVTELTGAADFETLEGIQEYRDKLPAAMADAKKNLAAYIPLLKEQIAAEKELNDELAIGLGLITREELVVQGAIDKHGEEAVRNYFAALINAEMIKEHGEEAVRLYYEAVVLNNQLLADTETRIRRMQEVAEKTAETIRSALYSAVSSGLTEALIRGAAAGMSGTTDVLNQWDAREQFRKTIGMAIMEAIVGGMIEGAVAASGLEALLTESGKIMGEYIRLGIAEQLLEGQQVRAEQRHEEEIARLNAVGAAIDQNAASETAAEVARSANAVAGLDRLQDLLDVQVAIDEDWTAWAAGSTAIYNAMENELARSGNELQRIIDAAGDAHTLVNAAITQEDARNETTQGNLQEWIDAVIEQRGDVMGDWDALVADIQGMALALVGSFEDMGFLDLIEQVAASFDISVDELLEQYGIDLESVENAAGDAISRMCDLRDYISLQGVAALGVLGSAGMVIETGQERRAFRDIDEGESTPAKATMNNNVTIEIDGSTLAVANVKSTAVAQKANMVNGV